jgi:hypothetical protein
MMIFPVDEARNPPHSAIVFAAPEAAAKEQRDAHKGCFHIR